MTLRPARGVDAGALAAVHAASFEAPWTAADITALLGAPGAFGVVAEDDALFGFILVRAMAGEAEVLTLAVDPGRRRQGAAAALLRAALDIARQAGAETMFLEVAEDNVAALGLYAAAGFELAGVRRAYYMSISGRRTDAKILRAAL